MRIISTSLFVFLVATNALAEGTQQNSTVSPYLTVYVAIVTALFGFVGSWLGAQVALLSFKRQRAFDKQLDWYERAARAIYSLAEKIQIAGTSEDNAATPSALEKQWRDVQHAHLVVDRISQEAKLYASNTAVVQIDQIAKKVQKLADETEAFDPPLIKASLRKEMIEKIYQLSLYLEKAAPPLLSEGRLHLGIDRRRIGF